MKFPRLSSWLAVPAIWALLTLAATACTAISAPTTITSSGEYCLTSNIAVTTPGANGITIAASNVILNLNGRAITGPNSGTGAGIYSTGQGNITIAGGNVFGFFYGIRLDSGTGHRVSRMDLSDNIFRGVSIMGPNATLEYTRIKGIRGTGGAYANSHTFAAEFLGPATVRYNQIEEIYPYGSGEGVGISINDVGIGTAIYSNTIKWRFKSAAGRTIGIWQGGTDPTTTIDRNVILNADYGLFRVLATSNATETFATQRCPTYWIDPDYEAANSVEYIGGCTDPQAGF